VRKQLKADSAPKGIKAKLECVEISVFPEKEKKREILPPRRLSTKRSELGYKKFCIDCTDTE